MAITDTELVRASGFCVVCDYRFTDELVARFPARSLTGGYGYVELRHLSAEDRDALLTKDVVEDDAAVFATTSPRARSSALG